MSLAFRPLIVTFFLLSTGLFAELDPRAASARADERLTRVFVLAGQSNMVGADAHAERIDEFPAFRGAGASQEDVLFCQLPDDREATFAGWGPLRPQRSFGPELTFARRVKTHVDGPLALIKSAVGGTTVAFDWNPDAPDKGQKLYPRTLRLVRAALADLDRRGVRYRLEGVLWHQGENDMLDRNLYPQYAAGLKRLVGQLREDLQAPELKWYVAEVSEKGIWGMDHRSNLGQLRQQQEQVLRADSRLRWVPTSHLAFEVMGSGQPHYHYGTQGQLQLGEAFATAYLREIDRAPPTVARRFSGELPIPAKGRVRLFVLAGQRNAEGEDAWVSEIPQATGFAALAKDQERVLFRYSLGGGAKTSRDWEPLGPIDYLNNFGPELSFGAKLRESLPAREGVAIVKFTHSGAQGPDWFPQGSAEAHRNLYPKFLAFVREAREDLGRRGYECSLDGIFWHVGENDTYFGPYVQQQAKWLQQLIDQTRSDLQQPELRWFLSEQHAKSPWRNVDQVNEALRKLAAADSRVTIVKTSHLPHGRHHFEAAGTLRLGEAWAEAYLPSR